jgi:hypothetical protein
VLPEVPLSAFDEDAQYLTKTGYRLRPMSGGASFPLAGKAPADIQLAGQRIPNLGDLVSLHNRTCAFRTTKDSIQFFGSILDDLSTGRAVSLASSLASK